MGWTPPIAPILLHILVPHCTSKGNSRWPCKPLPALVSKQAAPVCVRAWVSIPMQSSSQKPAYAAPFTGFCSQFNPFYQKAGLESLSDSFHVTSNGRTPLDLIYRGEFTPFLKTPGPSLLSYHNKLLLILGRPYSLK